MYSVNIVQKRKMVKGRVQDVKRCTYIYKIYNLKYLYKYLLTLFL